MSEPKQYRKKPVVVEAMRFLGTIDSANDIMSWINGHGGVSTWVEDRPEVRVGGGVIAQTFDPGHILIHTTTSVMRVFTGWFVVRGVEGEFYPCTASAFSASHEEESA